MSEINVKNSSVKVGTDFNSATGKWSAYHYTLVSGKESIQSITDYMFDDEKTAIKYIEDIAYFGKRNA